jgi:hypothetical protein
MGVGFCIGWAVLVACAWAIELARKWWKKDR